MLANKLKINDDKTEFLIFNSRSFDIEMNSLIFGSETINSSPSAENIGIYFDEKLIMGARFLI